VQFKVLNNQYLVLTGKAKKNSKNSGAEKGAAEIVLSGSFNRQYNGFYPRHQSLGGYHTGYVQYIWRFQRSHGSAVDLQLLVWRE